MWKSISSGRKTNHSVISDAWKKAGKLCRSMTMAYFHVLARFNDVTLQSANVTGFLFLSHLQLVNSSLQQIEFLLSYFSHFIIPVFLFFLYGISESLLY